MLNECDEFVVEHAADGLWTPVLNVTGVSAPLGENTGHRDWGESNPQYKESKLTDEYCAEEIEESPPFLNRFKRPRKTPVRFLERVMVAVTDPVTYKKAMRGSEENK